MASDEAKHAIGDNIDNRDQLSSLVLMGLAIAGGAGAVLVLALLG